MKRTVFTGLMVMLILSTAVTAQAAHTHEYTKQDSKVYVCECGKERPLYSLKGERVITLNCNGGSLYIYSVLGEMCYRYVNSLLHFFVPALF